MRLWRNFFLKSKVVGIKNNCIKVCSYITKNVLSTKRFVLTKMTTFIVNNNKNKKKVVIQSISTLCFTVHTYQIYLRKYLPYILSTINIYSIKSRSNCYMLLQPHISLYLYELIFYMYQNYCILKNMTVMHLLMLAMN